MSLSIEHWQKACYEYDLSQAIAKMYEANRPALEDRIQVMKEMWLKNIERQFSNHDHSGDLRGHQANDINHTSNSLFSMILHQAITQATKD